MNILIVEDDKDIVKTISILCLIRWPEAQIQHSAKGNSAVDMLETFSPDVILLDLGLPDMDGLDVLRQIRSFSNTPVIIVTVRADENEIFTALEAGADDYIVKPFGRLEIIARIQAVYRRKTDSYLNSPSAYGSLKYVPLRNMLYSGKLEIKLTRTEGLIIQELIQKTGNVVGLERLAELIWGEVIESSDEAIRLIIHRLRRKIESDPHEPRKILTKTGLGYYLGA